ncbi:MAG: CHAT domain-containing protein [Planctomycetota bacterium]|nr:CHAT domain-containing protein [Planctomycetota bacterium]
MASDAASILDAALAPTGFQARRDALLEHAAAFDDDLVQLALRRAYETMRVSPVDAEEITRLALVIAETLDSKEGRRDSLRAQAQAFTLAGRHGDAIATLDQALDLTDAEAEEQVATELRVLRLQSLTYLEKYDEAETEGNQILEAFNRLEDLKGVLRTRMALAELAIRRDRPRAALRHYHAVERALPPTASTRLIAAIAANRANALQGCNRYRAARRWFRRARELFRQEEGCEHTVAQMSYNLAYSSMLCGQFDDALHRFAMVEAEFARIQDDLHIAHVDLDRAEIHLRLNLPHDAAVYGERAEERFGALDLKKEQAQAAYFRGRAAEMAGQLEQAEDHYARAEQGLTALGLTELRLGSIVQRAYLANRRGDLYAARRLVKEASLLLEDEMNPLARASVGLLRATIELSLGRPSRALYAADEVVMECRRIHTPWLHIEAQRLIGKACAQRGQREHAILAYRSAIEQLERYRGGVPPDEYMAAFLGARCDLYGQIVDLLVARGDSDVAFQFTERAKARSLVDLLAGRERGARHKTPTPARMRYLRSALNTIYRSLFRANAEGIIPVGRGIPEAHKRAAELEDEMALALRTRRLGEQRTDGSIDVVDAYDLATIQADLDEDTALVEYLIAEDRLFTFVVTRDDIHAVCGDVDEEELRACMQRFHFHLAKYERPQVVGEDIGLQATRANLTRLREVLLDPVAEKLTQRRLVIVPHGMLHKVPFHALPWGDGWLADRFEVRYAPSASVYHHCVHASGRAQGDAAVFGIPDERAPKIRDEARQVALRLGTKELHLGSGATFERLQAAAPKARVLHLATHGMFHRKHPMLSAVRMGDTWVNLYDFYSLDVRGELVVLSTCESGTAAVTAGNEIIGLTRGLIYAGAPALLTSQWRVHDGATVEFMDAFYEALGRLPDAGAAYAVAMKTMRETHPHPYYWAPFFLTGCPVRQGVPGKRPAEAAAREPSRPVVEDDASVSEGSSS